MARSKHTDPRAVRSARRLAAPLEGRGAGDLQARRRRGLARKRAGAAGEAASARDAAAAGGDSRRRQPACGAPLRWIVRRPRRGFHHPAGKRDVLRLLLAVGPQALYGLRTVELGHAPAPGPATAGAAGAAALCFGRYEAPGRIVLVEQPLPPWRVAGRLPGRAARRLAAAGATLTFLDGAGATVVDWPPGALRRFMLEEVLLHEIGHHVLQRDGGKRAARLARTRDHEAFARRYGRRLRAAVFGTAPDGVFGGTAPNGASGGTALDGALGGPSPDGAP